MSVKAVHNNCQVQADLSPLSSNELLKLIKTVRKIHAERAGLRVTSSPECRSSFELAPIERLVDQMSDIRNRLIDHQRMQDEGMER
jgi:hypothetical protein